MPEESATDKMRSNVLGVRFVAEPFDQVRLRVREVLEAPARSSAYLCASGVHGVLVAQDSPDFRRILNEATFNLPDGMPIVLCSRALGFSDVERCFGPDVMWAVLEDSADLGSRHFFYGGNEGVAAALSQRAKAAFPGLGVAGSFCPPFRPLTEKEEEEIATLINESGADVVWVGLSTPKQERWIARMRERLDVRLICSVGAAFDYHTDSISPAPPWMQALALEWFYRLMQEPGRLWRRYAEIVPRFLFLITLQATGLRRFSVEE